MIETAERFLGTVGTGAMGAAAAAVTNDAGGATIAAKQAA